MAQKAYGVTLFLSTLSNHQKSRLVQVYFNAKITSSGVSFIPKEIESKFSDQVEQVIHSTVTRSLQRYVKVNILERSNESQRPRHPGKPRRNYDTKPGPASFYTTTKSEIAIRKFVLSLVPRGSIYGFLLESNVLFQRLKFQHYADMIYRKYADVKEYLRSKKSMFIVDSKLLDSITLQFLNDQDFLRRKSDKEIMNDATNLANEDVIKRNWENDELYTNFFIGGWRCYHAMEVSNI